MPRRKRKEKVMEQKGHVSLEPILQDFSITSLSDIKSDVLPPSDSSLFEKNHSYEVILPDITLNQTDDVNLSSDLYPPDSTLDFAKLNPSKPLFKKPFNMRSTKKPRLSIFDKDIQDSENDTPESKICRPFQKIKKVAINSSVFDDVFESSNENITHSKTDGNFITRQKRNLKKSVDKSLFDKDLNSSASVESCRVLPRRKIKCKKLNHKEFDQIFDDTLNGSQIDNTTTKRLPLDTLRKKDNNVESNLFDCDLNSSDSCDVSSMQGSVFYNDKSKSINISNDKSKNCSNYASDDTLTISLINKAVSKKNPFNALRNKVNIVESSLFDDDLESYNSLNVDVSSIHETCYNDKSISVDISNNKSKNCSSQASEDNLNSSQINKAAPKRMPFNTLRNKVNNVETSLFDDDLKSSDSLNVSSLIETCEDEKCTKPSNSTNNSASINDISDSTNENSSKISQSQKFFNTSIRKEKNVESNLFDSDLNSSYSLQLSSSVCDEKVIASTRIVSEVTKESSLSEDNNSDLHKRNIDKSEDASSHKLLGIEIIQNSGDTSLSGSKRNNVFNKSKCGTEEGSNHIFVGEVEEDHLKGNRQLDGCSINASKHDTERNLSHSLTEVEVNENSKVDHLSDRKSSNLNKCNEEGESHQYTEFDNNQLNKENSFSDSKSSTLVEVEMEETESSKHLTLNHSTSKHESIEEPKNNEERDPNLENGYNLLEVSNKISELLNSEPNKHFMQECVNVKDNSNSEEVELCCLETEESGKQNDSTLNFEDTECKDNPSVAGTSLGLPTENQKEIISSSKTDTDEVNNLFNVEITSNSHEDVLENNLLNTSKNSSKLLHLQSLPMQRSSLKTREILTMSGRTPVLSPEIPKTGLDTSNIVLDGLSISRISYEAADSSSPKFKKRRVSFLCDVEDINKSIGRRKSVRKSVRSNSSEQQSTSRLNRSQLSKSGFSLFIEQSSNSLTSDSAYIDIHPSLNKSTSRNTSNRNSSEYIQPSASITSRECDDSSKSTTDRLDSHHSLINESQQTEEDQIEQTCEIVVENKSTKEYSTDGLNETDSKDDSDEEDTQGEHEGTTHNLTDEEIDEDCAEEEIQEASETMVDDEESESEIEFNSEREEHFSEPALQQSFEKNPDHTEESCISAPNISRKECNSPFKVPAMIKKVKKKHTAALKPLPQPLNKTKVQEILDNMPFSELKVRTKRVNAASKPNEQNICCEKDKRKTRTYIVSEKLKKPAKWITPKLYLFLTSKLEPRFGIRSRIQAENVVVMLVEYVNRIMKRNENFFEIVEEMKCDLANLNIIKTHLDFHDFVSIHLDGHFQDKIFMFNDSNPFEPDDLLERIL